MTKVEEKLKKELLETLIKDEEMLRNTILTFTGQLQYNKKMQEKLKKDLQEKLI